LADQPLSNPSTGLRKWDSSLVVATRFQTHLISFVIGGSKDFPIYQPQANLRARLQYEIAFANTANNLPSGLEFQRPSITRETTAYTR
jgi:hypothetical protein